ncbi:MAG: ATP-binding protein [Anaerolineae bacterium]|jgi:ATP-dependent DNA helicase RecG
MGQSTLQDLVGQGESLTVEFKSDRGPLDDGELLNTIVCMANGHGGILLIGVEENGALTGLHPSHRSRPELLSAFIASRTVPPLAIETAFEALPAEQGEVTIAILRIPVSPQPIATSDGRLLVRYLDTHGQPGCRPLYPHELPAWRADRGQADVTAMPVPGATWEDLDPLEFARLRRLVEENRGDRSLLELSDLELAQALALVRMEKGRRLPTLVGLLLVGKEVALREYVPAHEVAFQVLHGLDVAVNEFRRWSLLRIHEWLTQAVEVRNEEQELMVNGFRVGVPRYDRRGLREAVNNALIHRDYTQLGAVHVQLHDDHVLTTNPGGFVAGVQVDKLLVTSPRPRNPALADAFKRIGLVERTGRGVSIIYMGQLRNGRPAPRYDRSTDVSVTVVLDSASPDLDFVLLTIQANRQLGRTLGVDELLALWEVRRRGAVNPQALAPLLQRDAEQAANVLENLVASDLLWADGQAYRLEPDLDAVPRAPESAVLQYVRTHGDITRREVVDLCDLSENQAAYLLKRLVEQGALHRVGQGRGTRYKLGKTRKNSE